MTNSNEGKISTKTILSQNYRNEYLFSEIYLQDITKRPVTDENLRASLRTIKEWREYADKTSIEQWITSYISPVLDILGFGHHKNSKKQVNLLILFPDVSKTQSMSLCYVVSPGEDMNCTLKGKHWAEKIIRSLQEHNFQWGILTDGFRWRIYHTKEPNPYETYVELDLETILNAQEYSAFQIFYLFFRPENFITSDNGECKFDTYKEESTKTTEYIEENLRAAIEREEEGGEGVLQTLCIGYLNTLGQNTYSEEERIRIYGGAILYLFRLLFLFYSTARDLLKVESIQAFRSIVQDSYQFHKEGGAQSNSCDLWLRLQDLFAEIDLTYNGGLFNPHESNLTRFIEETRITDPFLSEVVFGLGYYQKSRGNFVPIEYRDLSVRHLGSLYEGLLEHKLFIAEEKKVVRKSGNKVRYISVAKAGGISRTETIIEKGKIYFSEDVKERKLTGSYYTPEDVVEYIVKNTVDALLKEKKQELISEIEPILNDLESAINKSEQKRLKLFIDEKILKFIEEKILSLSVLDPTMGSGHFIVNATNYIANFIVELLNEYPGYNSKIDSNAAFWRRCVIENCIYGVDLNPLAVELAKLCLWITAAFKEKPLSFLNHHLKQGNALVGVSISDLEKFLEKSESKPSLFMQANINCIREAAEGYKENLSKLTEQREDIEDKKEILAELDKDISPYKHLCNLFTHYLLGELKENDLLLQIENWNKLDKTEKLPASLNSKNFFHWDLEFPDVFYDDNPGFDCVIGNPPYVKYSPANVHYSIPGYYTESCKNLFAFTVEKGFILLKNNGMISMILPLAAFSTKNMSIFKNFVINNSKKVNVSFFHFRPAKIFEKVNLPVSIFFSKKGKNKKPEMYTTGIHKWQQKERKYLFQRIRYVKISPEFNDTVNDFYYPKLMNEIENGILLKILKHKPIIKYKKEKTDSNNKNNIYYRTAGGLYWKVITNFKFPYESTSNKAATIKKGYINNIFVSLLNSSTFWWYYTITFDTFNLTDYLIFGFRFTYEKLNQSNLIKLNKFCEILMRDFLKNAIHTKRNNTKCINIYPRKSKAIIDEIDRVLGNHYGFSNDEIEYIINYDIKYRMIEEKS